MDAVATGSINLSGLTFLGPASSPDVVAGQLAGVILGNNSGAYDGYGGFTGPGSFGSGGVIFATSGSGDRFAVAGQNSPGTPGLAVPTGYTSGTPINGSAVFSGQTLSSLGLTPGTYVYTLPQSTITVQIGPASVPEPGSLALLAGIGVSGSVFIRRRKNAHKAL